jgi:hypothetical protein
VRSYLPDSFIPQYEGLRETLLSWLEVVGIAGSDAEKSTGQPVPFVSPSRL